MTTLTQSRTFTLTRLRNVVVAVALVGVIAGLIGVLTDSTAFFRAYLVGFEFVASLSLGSLFVLMIYHVTGGRWGETVRGYLELGAKLNVVTALMFIPIVLGLPSLYLWAQPSVVSGDALLQHQSPFLNPTFFIIRAVVYFAVWLFLSWWLTRQREGSRNVAIVGLLAHFPLATLASIDWFMSLEPHWYSTLYGVIFLVSQALVAFAFVMVIVALTTRVDTETEPQTRQDFGNVLLTMLLAWIYMNFMQFLVIWAGDLPEEITWYLARNSGGWGIVALALIVFGAVVPFVLLLSKGLKSHARTLGWIALLLLVVLFVFSYWLILPAFEASGAVLNWLDLVVPLGLVGIWVAVYLARLDVLGETD